MKRTAFCREEPKSRAFDSVIQLIKIKNLKKGKKMEQGLSADAPNGDSLRSGYFVFTAALLPWRFATQDREVEFHLCRDAAFEPVLHPLHATSSLIEP